jgi:hypothetical protein
MRGEDETLFGLMGARRWARNEKANWLANRRFAFFAIYG